MAPDKNTFVWPWPFSITQFTIILCSVLQQDQTEAAAVYEEFVASFSDTGKQSKTWVKGGVVNPDRSGIVRAPV